MLINLYYNEVFCFLNLELLIIIQLSLLTLYCITTGNLKLLNFPSSLLSINSMTGLLLIFWINNPMVVDTNLSINLLANTIYINFISFSFKYFAIICLSFVMFVNRSFLSTNKLFSFEYELLMLFSALALGLLAYSNDLLLLYLAIELQGLSIYSLIAIYSVSEISLEASIKYFILGAITSCFLLFGISYIYYCFGSISLNQLMLLGQNDTNTTISSVGILLLCITLLFKLGIAPFHHWVVDVYEGSITSLSLFFGSIPKVIFLLVLIKLLYITLANLSENWSSFIWLAGVTSVLLSSMAAIYQKRIKRLLAYSSIGQVGLICLALASYSIFTIKFTSIYLLLYLVMAILSFTVIILVTTKGLIPKFLINWRLVSTYNVLFSSLFVFTLLSLAGIPPLAGFYMKLAAILALLDQEYFLTLMFVVVLSCFSAFYYIRVIKVMLFTKTNGNLTWLLPESQITAIVATFLISLTLFVVICPYPLDVFSTLVSLTLV